MRAIVALLLFTLLAGCSVGGRIFGLAVAEDVTRITGALTNQEASATRLADSFALVRKGLEDQERRDLEQAEAIAELEAQEQEEEEQSKEGWSTEAKVATGSGLAATVATIISKMLDAQQGAERDRRHRDDFARERWAPPPRRRRRDRFVEGDDEIDEPELEDPPPRRGRLAPVSG